MIKFTTINRPVAITALGFGRNMRVIPRRIQLDGQSYTFIDSGVRAMVRRGGSLTQFLTLSDGERFFRLQCDEREHNWTLLAIGQ